MQLDINGQINAAPTPDDVVRAVDAQTGDDWSISLARDENSFVEAYVGSDGKPSLAFEEGDTYKMAQRPIDAVRIKDVLVCYLNGDDRWRSAVTWIAPPPVPKAGFASGGAAPPKALIVTLIIIALAAIVLPLVLPRVVRLPPPFHESGAVTFLVIVVGVVVALIVLVVGKVLESRRAAAWPQAGGRILASRVDTRYDSSDDGTSVKQEPVLEYEFSVGGTKYRGTRISIGEDTGGANLAATLVRYPVGATVMVFYDPKNPANCVLEPHMPEGLGKGCLVLLALAAAFAAAIYWLATEGPAFVTHHFPKAQAPFVLVATGFSALTLLFFFAMRRQAREAAHWPVANGRVLVSTTETFNKTESDGGSRTIHQPAVEYAYRVNGIDYRSRQIKLGTTVSGSKGFAAKIAARYPVGRDVEVRYDPKNPSTAALNVTSRAYWLILVAAMAVFGVAVMATGIFNQ
jgi:hypothetical protein